MRSSSFGFLGKGPADPLLSPRSFPFPLAARTEAEAPPLQSGSGAPWQGEGKLHRSPND